MLEAAERAGLVLSHARRGLQDLREQDPSLVWGDVDAGSELAGHADIRTTTIYTAVNLSRLEHAIAERGRQNRGASRRRRRLNSVDDARPRRAQQALYARSCSERRSV